MTLFNLYPDIAKKKIPLITLGISSRVYINWKKEGLLLEDVDVVQDKDVKRKKVYLNVFDALWLLIVQELRNFNLDLKSIRELRNFLLISVEFDIEKNTSVPMIDLADTIVAHLPIEQREMAKQVLLKNKVLDEIDEAINKETIIFFRNISIILFKILLKGLPVSIVIYKNLEDLSFSIADNDNSGSADKNEENYHFYQKQFSSITFLNVPIIPLLAKMFENKNFDAYFFDVKLYMQNEKKVLEALNDDMCKEIKIIKHNSGDLTLTMSKKMEFKDKHAKELRKILGLKQYEKIEIVYRNDNHLEVTNTHKDILKK